MEIERRVRTKTSLALSLVPFDYFETQPKMRDTINDFIHDMYYNTCPELKTPVFRVACNSS